MDGVLFQYGMSNRPRKDAVGERPFCQAIITQQWKFARYFSGLSGYALPTTLDVLMAQNDLVLFDVERDPDEIINLVQTKEGIDKHSVLVMELNWHLNRLLEKEATRGAGVQMPWLMADEPCADGQRSRM